MPIAEAERRMAEQLFLEALEKVESDSIRDWATAPRRHYEAWVEAAGAHLRKHEGRGDVNRFATLIVCTAIGL